MFDLTPRVLSDSKESGLVLEESHMSRRAIGICGALLALTFIVPAALSTSLIQAAVALVLGILVVGLPFLIVLAFSKYRRLEVRSGIELTSVTKYMLFPPRTHFVEWSRIERVICERRSDRSSVPGRMMVTLKTSDGDEYRVLSSWHADAIKAILRRHLAEKFEYTENFSSW